MFVTGRSLPMPPRLLQQVNYEAPHDAGFAYFDIHAFNQHRGTQRSPILLTEAHSIFLALFTNTLSVFQLAPFH